MKQKFFGLAACLLVMSLFFFGCGNGASSDDDTSGTPTDLGGVISQPPSSASGAPGGVWVDAQGRLRIQATLYDPDGSVVNGGEIKAEVWLGQGQFHELGTATISSEGVFDLTVSTPQDSHMSPLNAEMADDNGVPWPGLTVTNGNTLITSIDFFYYKDDERGMIYLSPLSLDEDVVYVYLYSKGSTSVRGSTTDEGYIISMDVRLNAGWNSLWGTESDTEQTSVSAQPPATARWIMRSFGSGD